MGITYVAVHGGAGSHSRQTDSEKELKRALKRACSVALDSLDKGAPALQAVVDAISVLEDDPCLNAGYGSNLTLEGTVECDAALMDGCTGDFGGVGAVSGIKNPIHLARSVLQHSRIPDTLGRIPPLTLVAQGASAFASSRHINLQMVSPESLISPRAKDSWVKWRARFDKAQASADAVVDTRGMHDAEDTVGAVAWDSSANTAAGVSSGGLLLKYPGRVGEAAIFGAGCWAEQLGPVPLEHDDVGTICGTHRIACSVSGAGEHIIRTTLARSLSAAIFSESLHTDIHEVINRVVVENFWKPCRSRGTLEPSVGILLLTSVNNKSEISDDDVQEISEDEDDFMFNSQTEGETAPRLYCAFTTPSMAIAYASSSNPTPKVMILRRHADTAHANSDDGNHPHVYITAISLS